MMNGLADNYEALKSKWKLGLRKILGSKLLEALKEVNYGQNPPVCAPTSLKHWQKGSIKRDRLSEHSPVRFALQICLLEMEAIENLQCNFSLFCKRELSTRQFVCNIHMGTGEAKQQEKYCHFYSLLPFINMFLRINQNYHISRLPLVVWDLFGLLFPFQKLCNNTQSLQITWEIVSINFHECSVPAVFARSDLSLFSTSKSPVDLPQGLLL